MQSKKRVMLIMLVSMIFFAAHAAQQQITHGLLTFNYLSLFDENGNYSFIVQELNAQSPANQQALLRVLKNANQEVQNPGHICLVWQKPMLLNRTPNLKDHLSSFCKHSESSQGEQGAGRAQGQKKQKKIEEEKRTEIINLRNSINTRLEQYKKFGTSFAAKLNHLNAIAKELYKLADLSGDDWFVFTAKVAERLEKDIDTWLQLYEGADNEQDAAGYLRNAETLALDARFLDGESRHEMKDSIAKAQERRSKRLQDLKEQAQQRRERAQQGQAAAAERPVWQYDIGRTLQTYFLPSQVEQANQALRALPDKEQRKKMIDLLWDVNALILASRIDTQDPQQQMFKELESAITNARNHGVALHQWTIEDNVIMQVLKRIDDDRHKADKELKRKKAQAADDQKPQKQRPAPAAGAYSAAVDKAYERLVASANNTGAKYDIVRNALLSHLGATGDSRVAENRENIKKGLMALSPAKLNKVVEDFGVWCSLLKHQTDLALDIHNERLKDFPPALRDAINTFQKEAHTFLAGQYLDQY